MDCGFLDPCLSSWVAGSFASTGRGLKGQRGYPEKLTPGACSSQLPMGPGAPLLQQEALWLPETPQVPEVTKCQATAFLRPTSLAYHSMGCWEDRDLKSLLADLYLCVSRNKVCPLTLPVLCAGIYPKPRYTTGGQQSRNSVTRVISSFCIIRAGRVLARAKSLIDS